MRVIVMIAMLWHALFGMNDFLMPEEAFKPRAAVEGDTLRVTIDLAEGVYLYKERLEIALEDEGAVLSELRFPEALDHDGKAVYEHSVTVEGTLTRGSIDAQTLSLLVGYQGCSQKGLCYEPVEKQFVLNVDPAALGTVSKAPAVTGSETDAITATFASGNIALVLLSFFGFGLLLSLTPCVFPMIPILSSIIVSQGEGMNARRGFMLSSVYVLSMSIAYTMAGVLAGLFGSNIQASMQNPWVLSAFAGVFIVLALSMFGFFEIGLPASLQSRLSNSSSKAGSRGGFAGVGVMGFLSALIVGPCVAPPLAGALVYIGQSGDALLGGAALFVMSLGMGAPLLLVGTGAGKFMPKPGGWMRSVSKVFGVMMLGIAIWMLGRILPAPVTMALWALLFIVISVYLGAFEGLDSNGRGWNALAKGGGVFVFLVGMALLLGVLGGATNPLQPLEGFIARAAAAQPQPGNVPAEFVKVRSIAELDDVLQQHRGKKVMLDFYADWCVACKELEHSTFSDPQVRAALGEYVLVQADVTANGDAERALSKKYGVFGPPSILFFDEKGERQPHKNVVGYKPPSEFMAHLVRS